MRLLPIVLIIFVFAIFAIDVHDVHALEDGVYIPLVADSMSDTGEVGSYLNAQVIVTNGTGHVFVDTNPYTQVDLQGSARIAAMVATDVLGLDEKSYDFYYIIDVESPIIGGPSAGGALTVATIAAINHWSIKPGIAMTGMIDPDETIGPVGGIPFKLQAAAAHNTTEFLVPQGQLIVNITNTTSIRRGPFIASQSKVETVDLRQLGKKLNVKVKEVSTIQDAVLEFTGHDLNKPIINKSVYTTNYLNLLEPLSRQLRNESLDMYNSVSKLDNNVLLNDAKDLQNRADNLSNDKKYYASTSLYFASLVDLLTIQWQYQYNQEQNKDQYISDLINIVEKQINDSKNNLNQFKSAGISNVEITGAAESRITEANTTLEKVRNLNNSNEIISSLAFANERARSAQWWLTLGSTSGKVIPDQIVKERSGWYLGQANSIDTYVQALISESGAHQIVGLGDTSDIQKEIDNGYYSGALFDSLQMISRLSTVIELLGTEDPSHRVISSESSAQASINEARSAGIEPTLAVSVYEFAGTLTNPFDAISQYTYAKNIAKVTESLDSRAIPSNKTIPQITVSNMQSINNVPNPVNTSTGAGSKKSPAFEAISLLIVLIFVRIKRFIR